MAAEGLPNDVRKFISSFIFSVEQIEALLLLKGDPSLELTPEEVAKRLYTTPESATARLADLHRSGLLSEIRSDALRYRFEPRTEQLRAGTEALAEAYAKRKVAVINEIFAAPSGDVQSFADAFRFRKDED